ncbi:hypothetical protein ACIQAC_12820 [Streptomyces sp. NPDC088387]|uniref:hypothetical protein n=1 Tax=Streptomyces sp. NPDC088387 TaxID=3365859 RepID=UPI0037FEF436
MRGWRGKARELAAVAGALAVAIALTLWTAPTAAAGGPTSALVVSPESMEATGLYAGTREYKELQWFLGEPETGPGEMPAEVDESSARQLNVTWMIHDVSPYRYDRVYVAPDAEDVWIHTSTNPPTWTGNWHKASEPTRLAALFEDLGLMGESSKGGSYGIPPTPGPAEQPAAQQTEEDRTAVAAATSPDGTDWWWAIAGLVAGAALALLLRTAVLRLPELATTARLRREERGTRQELRDN